MSNGSILHYLYDKFIRDTGQSHKDRYLCSECKTIVFEKDWCEALKCCSDCSKEIVDS